MSEGHGGSPGRTGFTPLNVLAGSAPSGPATGDQGEGGVEAEIAALGERVGELIEALSGNEDPAVATQLDELLDAIDHLHREALTRLSGLLAHHDLLGHASEDPLIAATLDLYDLRSQGGDPSPSPAAGAVAPSTPAPAAPAASRPALIPLNGPANAVPAPARPSALGIDGRVAVGSPDASPRRSPVPMAPTSPSGGNAEVEEWSEVCSEDDLPSGTVIAPDEGALLLASVDGNLHGYRNGCGNGPLALHMGRVIDGRRLVCPWHLGCVYDLTSGVSGEPPDQRRLIRYPVRVRDGMVEVAFNRGSVPVAAGTAPSPTG